MSLLVPGVLGDEVKVFAADDECAVHLGADDGAGEDTAADGDHAGEGAFLVCANKNVSLLYHSIAHCQKPRIEHYSHPFSSVSQ